MRRFLLLCLITIYTAFAAGVPVYAHMCGGEVVKKSVLVPTGGCMGGEEEPNGCCHDHKSLVKLDKGHKAEVNSWNAVYQAQVFVPAPVLLFERGVSLFDGEPIAQNSPAVTGFGDLPPPVPLYIFFSCLKIAAPCRW